MSVTKKAGNEDVLLLARLFENFANFLESVNELQKRGIQPAEIGAHLGQMLIKLSKEKTIEVLEAMFDVTKLTLEKNFKEMSAEELEVLANKLKKLANILKEVGGLYDSTSR